MVSRVNNTRNSCAGKENVVQSVLDTIHRLPNDSRSTMTITREKSGDYCASIVIIEWLEDTETPPS